MKLIPFTQCLDVNLYDKSKVNIIALHETGHLITMYAMDMMNYFSSITIQAGDHTNEVTGAPDKVGGCTYVTQDLMDRMRGQLIASFQIVTRIFYEYRPSSVLGGRFLWWQSEDWRRETFPNHYPFSRCFWKLLILNSLQRRTF